MTAHEQPELLPDGKIHIGSVVTHRRPEEVALNVTREEFLTLCEGDTSDCKGKRDFGRGMFFAAVLALFGLLASTDWGTFDQRKHVWPFWLFVVVFLLGVGVFGMAWFKDSEHLKSMKSIGSPRSRLVARLDAQFMAVIKQSEIAALEDHAAILVGRIDKVLAEIFKSGWSLNASEEELSYRIHTEQGTKPCEVRVPKKTPLDAVEQMVRKQIETQLPKALQKDPA